MSEKLRVHIIVEGRVQGAFFRQATLNKAKEIRVFGFVRNLPDGKVEAVFEGRRDGVEKIAEWMKDGPKYAKVDEYKINFEEFKGEFSNFNILY